VFANVVIVLPFLLIQIYNAFFDYANFFKDIFNLFSKVLIINEKKKQQLTVAIGKIKAIKCSAKYQKVVQGFYFANRHR